MKRVPVVDGRILPKASAADLEWLCADPQYWDLIDQIADHPSCWPELVAWVERWRIDPGTVGAPPNPPEPVKQSIAERFRHQRREHDPFVESHAEHSSIVNQMSESSSDIVPADLRSELEAVSEIPRRTIRSRLRTLAVPLLAVILTCAIVAGVALVMGSRHSAPVPAPLSTDSSAELTAQREHADAMEKARLLIAEIESGPVADDGTVKVCLEELTEILASADATAKDIDEAAELVTQAVDAAVSTKASSTRAELDRLIAVAGELADAPESENRAAMNAVAGDWANTSVTGTNLRDALEACTTLGNLIEATTQEKEDAERRAQEERDAQEKAKAQVVPQQQPSRTPSQRHSTTATPSPAPTSSSPQPVVPQPQPSTSAPSGNDGAVIG